MIYAGDHKTLLYTKYINYGPHRKDFFNMFFSIIRLLELLITRGFASGLGWQDLIGGHLTLPHTKYNYMVSEDFFFHNTCGYIDPPGVASFDPIGLDWQDL